MTLLKQRITHVWLCLAVLTGLSWWLVDGVEPGTAEGVKYLAVSLLLLAFFKVRLVILHFMEVQNAPWLLRGLLETWVLLMFVGTCSLYLMGGRA